MVVIAENITDAIGLSMVQSSMIEDEWENIIHGIPFKKVWRDYGYYYKLREGSWTKDPECRLIAENINEPEGVLCADYNAG